MTDQVFSPMTQEAAVRFTVEDDTLMTRRVGQQRYCIYDDDFGYDAVIRIHGDFAKSQCHREYLQAVCDALNASRIPTSESSRWSEADDE